MCKINQGSDAISLEVFAERMFANIDSNHTEQFCNSYAEASQARVPYKVLKPVDATGFDTAAKVGATGTSDTDNKEEISSTVENDLSIISAVKPRKQKSYSDKHLVERSTNGEPARLMSVKEVAAYLSVSISKVWRLSKYDVGFPKPVHIAGSTRWDRYSIDSYLDRLQTIAHLGK